MRWFFARLKSYIQYVTDIDFEPTEVIVHYNEETEEEKQQIIAYEMVIELDERRQGKPVLEHEVLATAAFASCDSQKHPSYYLSELKKMSRRSMRERRYIDSFRYGFLIVEALYGKGQFRNKKLSNALKKEDIFMNILNRARYEVRHTIEKAKDDTEKIIWSDYPTEDLVDHIVKKRGYYFHAKKKMIHDEDWTDKEGQALCNLLNIATDMICYELTREIYDDEMWKLYEQHARKAGMVTDAEMRCHLWSKLKGQEFIANHREELIGDPKSPRNRIKWALSAFEGLKYDEKSLDFRKLVCKVYERDDFLFIIIIKNTKMYELRTNVKNQGEIPESEKNYAVVVTYYFAEEEETKRYTFGRGNVRDYSLPDNSALKWLISDALRLSRLFCHDGLHRITCREAGNGEVLFDIYLCSMDKVKKEL